jgi:caffeoyl-CoA O-methyltransferase
MTAVIAESLTDEATLISLEEDSKTFDTLSRNIMNAGLGSKVRVVQMDGFKWLEASNTKYDFILLDARKESYADNYSILIDHLASGAILVIDNVLCHGKVLKPQRDFEIAMRRFNEMLSKDYRMMVTMLPIRDGITIARRK